jgi:hypothetical protein
MGDGRKRKGPFFNEKNKCERLNENFIACHISKKYSYG